MMTLADCAEQAQAFTCHLMDVEDQRDAWTAAYGVYDRLKSFAMTMPAASLDDVLTLAAFARTEVCAMGDGDLTKGEVISQSKRLASVLTEIMIGLCRFGGVPKSVAAADYDTAVYLAGDGILSLRKHLRNQEADA